MWLKFIVRSFIPAILDVVVAVLADLAKDTESDIDDQFVATLAANKAQIAEKIIDLL